jgi:hypothetical protein
MQKQTKKGRISSYLNRFFSNFWVQLILSVAVLALIVAVMFDAIAIGIIGHSVWFEYPK